MTNALNAAARTLYPVTRNGRTVKVTVPVDEARCEHPPARLRSWMARDDSAPKGQVLCVACCQCGAVLKGGC